MKTRIDKAFEKCKNGICLTKEEIVELLEIKEKSEDDIYLKKKAYEAAKYITGSKAYIWCAVGMDFAPCKMNCRFCSFGEKWNITKDERHVTWDEIIKSVETYAKEGAAYIILRTTQDYDFDTLLNYVPHIYEKVPGKYKLVLNTGELNKDMVEKAYNAGVYGAYHALRLREGKDTPFSIEVRTETMRNIGESHLKLISLVEPVGLEHTNEEIAEIFLNTVSCGAVMSGLMARIPVDGTPFEGGSVISDERISHIIAVLRLSGGNVVKDICVHPYSRQAFKSGANVLVVENGAIPRESTFSENDFIAEKMKRAREIIEDCEYSVSQKD